MQIEYSLQIIETVPYHLQQILINTMMLPMTHSEKSTDTGEVAASRRCRQSAVVSCEELSERDGTDGQTDDKHNQQHKNTSTTALNTQDPGDKFTKDLRMILGQFLRQFLRSSKILVSRSQVCLITVYSKIQCRLMLRQRYVLLGIIYCKLSPALETCPKWGPRAKLLNKGQGQSLQNLSTFNNS